MSKPPDMNERTVGWVQTAERRSPTMIGMRRRRGSARSAGSTHPTKMSRMTKQTH